MSSEIRCGDQFVWVANRVLDRLLHFAEIVGRATAGNAAEEALVDELASWHADSYYPGIHFDLEAEFTTIEARQFWARVFLDVSRRVFVRELGKHDMTFWQSETIGVAFAVGGWLTRCVQVQLNEPWHPETEDGREATIFFDSRSAAT